MEAQRAAPQSRSKNRRRCRRPQWRANCLKHRDENDGRNDDNRARPENFGEEPRVCCGMRTKSSSMVGQVADTSIPSIYPPSDLSRCLPPVHWTRRCLAVFQRRCSHPREAAPSGDEALDALIVPIFRLGEAVPDAELPEDVFFVPGGRGNLAFPIEIGDDKHRPLRSLRSTYGCTSAYIETSYVSCPIS